MYTATRTHFDPALYPRDYRVSRGYRSFLRIMGGIAVAGGCLAIWFFVNHNDSPNGSGNVLGAALFFLFVLLGIYLIVYSSRYKVSLRADAIVVEEVFTHKTLLRSDIAGRRLLPTQYVSTLVLIPRSSTGKKLKVGMSLEIDPASTAWMADFPDLDAEDLAESSKELAADPDRGFASEQRPQRIAGAKKIAATLSALTAVSFLWGLFYPKPYLPLTLTLTLLPIFALIVLVRSRGIYQVEGRRLDTRPSLALVLFLPGIALWIVTVRTYRLLDWGALLLLAIAISALITVVIAASDRATHKRWFALLPFLIFNVSYGYALVGETNRLFDLAPPQRFQVTVFDKYVVHRKSFTYVLVLDRWGPQTNTSRVSVPQSLYDSIIPGTGSRVCIDLHAGAWRIPWYMVNACP